MCTCNSRPSAKSICSAGELSKGDRSEKQNKLSIGLECYILPGNKETCGYLGLWPNSYSSKISQPLSLVFIWVINHFQPISSPFNQGVDNNIRGSCRGATIVPVRVSQAPPKAPPGCSALSSWWPDQGWHLGSPARAVGARWEGGVMWEQVLHGKSWAGQVISGRNSPEMIQGRWFTSQWLEARFSSRENECKWALKEPNKNPSVYWLFSPV